MMRSRAVMSSEDSLDRSVISRRFQLALLLMAAQATLTGVPFKATRKSYTKSYNKRSGSINTCLNLRACTWQIIVGVA